MSLVLRTTAVAICSRLTVAGNTVFVAYGVFRALCVTRVRNKQWGDLYICIYVYRKQLTRGGESWTNVPHFNSNENQTPPVHLYHRALLSGSQQWVQESTQRYSSYLRSTKQQQDVKPDMAISEHFTALLQCDTGSSVHFFAHRREP